MSAHSWHAIPTVLFHEILIHVFQFGGTQRGWQGTEAYDPFAEGTMDRLAHEELLTALAGDALKTATRDRVAIGEAAGAMAHYRTYQGASRDDSDPYASSRRLGSEAYVALRDQARASQRRLHQFLAALNTRDLDLPSRYRIVDTLLAETSELSPKEADLRDALVGLDADGVEQTCRTMNCTD